MKTPRKKEEISEIRKMILDTAIDIIAANGLEALTMRKLASRTKMTAPNLYNYFSGKDEIYIALVISGFKMLQEALVKAGSRHGRPADRAKAVIAAYMQFGFEHPRYYDIMFTLPTPRYNDYIGTPLEPHSEIEFRISMEIVDMSIDMTRSLMGPDAEDHAVRRRVIEIWSLIHGMITLYNSRVVGYVADDPKSMYSQIIDDFIDSIFRPTPKPDTAS